MNIPSFNLKAGDCVICFHELELGLVAKSCTAPGAATLLSNMIRTPAENLVVREKNQLVHDYFRGCQMEVVLGLFSRHFNGMEFFDAVS